MGSLCWTMLRYVHHITVKPEVHMVRKAGGISQNVTELTGIHMMAAVATMVLRSSDNFLLTVSIHDSQSQVNVRPSLRLYAQCSKGVTKHIKQGFLIIAPGTKNKAAFRID